jgi:hypothetical protein
MLHVFLFECYKGTSGVANIDLISMYARLWTRNIEVKQGTQQHAEARGVCDPTCIHGRATGETAIRGGRNRQDRRGRPNRGWRPDVR